MKQGNGILKGPSIAVEGSTIEVEVATGHTSIQVAYGGPDNTRTLPVPSNGRVTVPIPAGSGPAIAISVGRGLNRKFLVIEVISQSP